MTTCKKLEDSINAFEIYKQAAARYGYVLYNPNDKYIGRSLDLYGEYSQGEVEIFRQIIKPGWTILDIGANIGCHTVFLADLVAGIWTALGITAASTQRHETNRGQRVDTSLLAGVVGLLCVQGQGKSHGESWRLRKRTVFYPQFGSPAHAM